MNTRDSQEQQEKTQSLFSTISFRLQNGMSYCLEKKQLILIFLGSVVVLIALIGFWINQTKKSGFQDLLQAEDLVSKLRSPYTEKAHIPPYKTIVETLTASSEIQKKFNGELRQESIVANQASEHPVYIIKDAPFPLREWPWKDLSSITDQLESNNLSQALPLLTTLIQEIERSDKSAYFVELLGYLRLMETKCLHALRLPSSQAAVEFEKWKTTYPELDKRLSSCLPEESR